MRVIIIILLCVLCFSNYVKAECPQCDVPTGYENGINNKTQLFDVVTGWEDEVEVSIEPNEICCCCFTTDFYSDTRADEPIAGYDCSFSSNPDCKIRAVALVWVVETLAVSGDDNRDENGNMSGSTYVQYPWTRIEVSCNGSGWMICPDSMQFGSPVNIFVPDCYECP